MGNWYRWQDQNLVINVQLQPRARQNQIMGIHGDALKIRITAPPVDGKANTHLCQFLSNLLDVPASSIDIISGETSRNKRVCIQLKNKVLPDVFVDFA